MARLTYSRRARKLIRSAQLSYVASIVTSPSCSNCTRSASRSSSVSGR
jgi:hypothetical protein